MCGCIASHRIAITSAPPKDYINDEHSQTQYDLILRLHLTIAIAITVDSRPHSRMMQKNPPLKKSPKQYILKNACTQPPVPTIVHAKRKDKKTGHIAPLLSLHFIRVSNTPQSVERDDWVRPRRLGEEPN
ncbi:uncharacterized protein EAE98_001707 [Botrytis deweyae]|uniref:Uncharacterized protein n=1 Tax=Botrytis deweyae TaxID=2478750 RepID=A0ABQ7IYT3_9HELO|nr:uncharacterized protein EAE98_001707 [Botrytis deweyae]KAF7937393.1 hypothetical protein EAE98_001707 [Botrytis deweyae]